VTAEPQAGAPDPRAIATSTAPTAPHVSFELENRSCFTKAVVDMRRVTCLRHGFA
jgi:hypothetical protein